MFTFHVRTAHSLRNAARALANLPMCSLAEWNFADVNHSFAMFQPSKVLVYRRLILPYIIELYI